MRSVARAVVLLFWTTAVAELCGQTYQGGVRGAVHDRTGVVPAADVRLINEDTNLSRGTTTNQVGEYGFPNVVPGVYTVRASLAGFKTFESRGIRVGTQEFFTLDLLLEVGDLREAITVVGAAPVIETANASVSTLLERAALDSLPNVGRNPFVISTIAPNVIPTGFPQFVRQQDQNASAMLSLGGGPRRANSYLLDGVPIGDIFNRAAIQPSIEALEEVKVQVSTYDAEMGRTAGGVFNATHRSGSNAWRGSALMLERPQWGTGTPFFTKQAGQPKPDTYYHLWAGSFGGPLVKNHTFFWASTEGYKTRTAATAGLILPTALERLGDFSQSPSVIYDPKTTRPDPARPGQFIRDPFPGNVIPPDRINPVGRSLINLLPLPTAGRSASRSALPIADFTNQATVKVDHRLKDQQIISSLFAWYHSNEPSPQFYGTPGDPGAAFQPRTVNVLALNDVVTISDRTVLAVRYGYMRFRDDVAWAPSTAAGLGFSSAYQQAVSALPLINVTGYGIGAGGELLNGGSRSDSTFYSQSLNASLSHLAGRHTIKAGAEYRLIGMNVFTPDVQNGAFFFTQAFTAGPSPNAASGDAMASLLLGFPARGEFQLATAGGFFTQYIAGYLQDDFRLRDDVSVNLGLRYDFEQGLRERNNAFTVGFDRERPFPIQVPGLNLKGGLMYAGVDGYPTSQGNPSHLNFAPRGGIAWSLVPRAVVRAGYGLFWAPSQIPQATGPGALGTRGFTGVTSFVASDDGGLTPCATCSLADPFPRGFEQPRGAAQGLLTGAGGDIDFVDEFSTSAHVHQYSVDLRRELRGKVAASVAYLGSRSEHLTVGGTSDGTVNINQLDPNFLALGAGLQAAVPNPFYGLPQFGILSTQPTIAMGQLLRPYPQFGQVRAHRATEARARYNAVTFSIERRQHDRWGARANYTYSVRKDNQFGEGNVFTSNPQGAVDNADVEREFGNSLIDTPHRLNISGTLELPFEWAVSGVGSYQSGFPIVGFQPANPAGVFGFGQRPNVVDGVDPRNPGSPEANYDPACTCIRWLNPAAWSSAAPFTLGDAPRTDARVRTPLRTNWDVALQKSQVITGRRVTLRAELINVFDSPAFFGPRVGYGLATFGTIGGAGGFPRTLQLTAKVAW